MSDVKTKVKYDDSEDSFVIERVQDIESVLERNKALYTHNDGYSKSRELRRVASIPMVVIEQWLKEGIDIYNPDHAEAVKRKLNDSENMFLRTAPGRL